MEVVHSRCIACKTKSRLFKTSRIGYFLRNWHFCSLLGSANCMEASVTVLLQSMTPCELAGSGTSKICCMYDQIQDPWKLQPNWLFPLKSTPLQGCFQLLGSFENSIFVKQRTLLTSWKWYVSDIFVPSANWGALKLLPFLVFFSNFDAFVIL